MSEAIDLKSRTTSIADGIPLAEINPANPVHFETGTELAYFERLRREDPVHYCPESKYGPYWSVTRYDDIMAVDTNHQVYSSEANLGGIIIDDTLTNDVENEFTPVNFIAMDPPKHDGQRLAVNGIVSPMNLAALETLIRERTVDVLDRLPVNEEFDWVSTVSIELTTRMLATLFDFPFEERAKLTRWSDLATAEPGNGIVDTQEQRIAELMQCLQEFTVLWNERVNEAPRGDLVSMLAHGEATKNMPPNEYLGNLLLLIVGGNDTTRNSMSGSVYALNKFPSEYDKLRKNPALVNNLIKESIRWQTPLAHMRRTALQDAVLGGKQIRKGDKVIMWYLSGNRDENLFSDADAFIIDRPNAHRHQSFGFGIHRCMGLKLGELQLRILWEEILKRFENVEVVGEPTRVRSNFVRGYASMPVRLTPKA